MLFCYTDSFHDNCGSHREFQYTNLEIFLSSLKSAWDLIYPGQNRDVREILSNLIGLLEDWKLEKTATNYEKQNPGLVSILIIIISNFSLHVQTTLHLFTVSTRSSKNYVPWKMVAVLAEEAVVPVEVGRFLFNFVLIFLILQILNLNVTFYWLLWLV